ncbi:MAG TPA: TVP38/TMEM64 family protein [Steroidobacteraceae bacterium]|nr:TVP38/TMEM64 family protein [Steroidobacteraceae bacterium]
MRARGWWLLVALALVLAAGWLLPVKDWLRAALAWAAVHPGVAWLVYAGLYVLATVCLVPGLILTLAGGALFGVARGVLLVSASSVLGATAAFLLGRSLAREWISRRIAAWPKFRALDRALAQRGFWIVLLTRLSPLFPFNLLNYAYGVSAVRLRDYLLGSWIGMAPATVLYVYAGSAAASLARVFAGGARPGRATLVLLIAGLAATAGVIVLATHLARRELERELAA